MNIETDISPEAVERLAKDHDAVGNDPVRCVMGHPHQWKTAKVLRKLSARVEELEAQLAGMAGLWAKTDSEKQLLLGRVVLLEANLEKAEKIIADAKEMYETAMLTGGGSPEAWVNHVRARNAFASTLEELKGQDDE